MNLLRVPLLNPLSINYRQKLYWKNLLSEHFIILSSIVKNQYPIKKKTIFLSLIKFSFN